MAIRSITFLTLLILLGISSWALFNPNFFYIHDYLHAARIAEMARGLSDLHLPVRWSQNFGYGFGMPLFEFYAPLPYFVGALFLLMGVGIVASMQILFIISNLVTIVSSYFLGKNLFGRVGGLVIATLYGLAPYRAVNLYVRGALSESWGMMFFPLILLIGINFIKKKDYFSWLSLIFSIAGLLLSHNLSALVFLPLSAFFFAFYTALMISKKKLLVHKKIILIIKTAVAYILAFLLSLFYILPALAEKHFTRLETFVIGGYFDYKLHFVGIKQFFDSSFGYGGSGWEGGDDISFFLGWGVLIGILLTVLSSLFFTLKKKRVTNHSIFLLFLLFIGGLSLLMTHNKSAFLWELITFLKFLQFPWRWLAVVAIYFSIFSAGFLWFIPKKSTRIFLSGLLILVSGISALNFFKPEYFLDDANKYYFSDKDRIQNELSKVLPDYLPATFSTSYTKPPEEIFTIADQSNDANNINVNIKTNKVNKKELKISSDNDSILTFAIADYPGWKTFIDDIPADHKLSQDGLITLNVPEGSHTIKAEFRSTVVRYFSDWVSGLSLFAMVIASIIAIRMRNKNESKI